MGIDVEDGPAASAVQLVVWWGGAPVGVHVVASGERFAAPPGRDAVDSAPLVAPGDDGRPQLIAPAGAIVSRRPASGDGLPRDGLEGRGARRAVLRVRDPEPTRINVGTALRVEMGALTVEVEGIAVARPAQLGRWWAGWLDSSLPHVAASAACHVLVLGMIAWLASPFAAFRDSLSDEQRGLIQRYLRAAAESEAVSLPVDPRADARPEPPAQAEERARGPEGAMGDPRSTAVDRRAAQRWRALETRPAVAAKVDTARRGLEEAASFGMVGLLDSSSGANDEGLGSPWGRRDAQGRQLEDAHGGLWGGTTGDSFGAGGLGLSGIGAGGGGRGQGIGLGGIGALGRMDGTGREAVLRRSARMGPTYVCGSVWLELPTKVEADQEMKKRPEAELSCAAWSPEDPTKCTRWSVADHSGACSTSVSGRLPPEVIQAVLRQNHGRFRLCYQAALQHNPSLRGRVVLQFTIAPRGEVTRATATGDLPDANVVSCMERAIRGLQFPQSVSGSIAVTYPLVLRPAI